jgi:hypothetical protein
VVHPSNTPEVPRLVHTDGGPVEGGGSSATLMLGGLAIARAGIAITTATIRRREDESEH